MNVLGFITNLEVAPLYFRFNQVMSPKLKKWSWNIITNLKSFSSSFKVGTTADEEEKRGGPAAAAGSASFAAATHCAGRKASQNVRSARPNAKSNFGRRADSVEAEPGTRLQRRHPGGIARPAADLVRAARRNYLAMPTADKESRTPKTTATH